MPVIQQFQRKRTFDVDVLLESGEQIHHVIESHYWDAEDTLDAMQEKYPTATMVAINQRPRR